MFIGCIFYNKDDLQFMHFASDPTLAGSLRQPSNPPKSECNIRYTLEVGRKGRSFASQKQKQFHLIQMSHSLTNKFTLLLH